MKAHAVSPSEEETKPSSDFALKVRIEKIDLLLKCSFFSLSLHILERMLEIAGFLFSSFPFLVV